MLHTVHSSQVKLTLPRNLLMRCPHSAYLLVEPSDCNCPGQQVWNMCFPTDMNLLSLYLAYSNRESISLRKCLVFQVIDYSLYCSWLSWLMLCTLCSQSGGKRGGSNSIKSRRPFWTTNKKHPHLYATISMKENTFGGQKRFWHEKNPSPKSRGIFLIFGHGELRDETVIE